MRHHPILRRLILLLIVLIVSACGESGPSASGVPSSPTLAGSSWIVVSVGGRPPIAGAVPTLAFDGETVTGSGGCNHFGGRFQIDAPTGRFAVRDAGMTAMGCLQPGVNEFETVFMQALGQASQATTDANGRLLLDGPGGRIVLAARG